MKISEKVNSFNAFLSKNSQASACLAGDSAAYQRTSLYGDDVVIVAYVLLSYAFTLSGIWFSIVFEKFFL